MTDAVLLAAIESLRRDVAGLRVEVRELLDVRSHGLSAADRAVLSRLLPALGGAFGTEPFAAADVADAPGPAVVLAGWSAKRIGKLLARAVGVGIDGLTVERIGVGRDGLLWQVIAM